MYIYLFFRNGNLFYDIMVFIKWGVFFGFGVRIGRNWLYFFLGKDFFFKFVLECE